PPVFALIASEGNIDKRDMFNTFNMGVGMILVIDNASISTALSVVEGSYVIGHIEDGEKGVSLC
ncbi:MAG: phosphoribosylformylglycinamidine cyclo-ligase, partial [Sphaerochaetaceae bacterium]